MSSMLEILQKYKESILQMENAALFHDLDKGMLGFCEDPLKFHTLKEYKTDIDETKRIKRERWEQLELPEDAVIPSADIQFDRLISDDDDVNLDKTQWGKLSDPFVLHHYNKKAKFSLAALIVHAGGCAADGFDSALDKGQGTCLSAQTPPFQIVTPFQKITQRWNNSRLSEVAELYRSNAAIREYKPILSSLLGETRKPLNDVTLWDHSFNVASFAKTLSAKILVEYLNTAGEYHIPKRDGKRKAIIGYLKVEYDLDYLLGNAHEEADLIHFHEEVNGIMNEIRVFYEGTLLCGNEYYSDHHSQIFTFPRIVDNLREQFESEIQSALHEKMRNVLRKCSLQELPFGFAFRYPDNGSDNALLNCGANLMKTSLPTKQDTILLLELASEAKAGRICDLCGIRNTAMTERENQDHLCQICAERRNRDIVSKTDRSVSKFSELLKGADDENKLALFSIQMNLDKLRSGEIFKEPVKNSPGRQTRSVETISEFFKNFLEVGLVPVSERGYFPILCSPERLDFIVPASVIDGVLTSFIDAHKNEFGEFTDSLLPKIAMIAFHQKFPIYAVLDAAKRMSAYLDFGCFDFMLLDSSAERFVFSKNGRKHHILRNANRYNLEDAHRFAKLWEIIGKLPKSQLRGIEGSLVSKFMEWNKEQRKKEEFRMLCELYLFAPNALKKLNCSPGERQFVLDAAVDGSLLDTIDLFVHIQTQNKQ